MEEKYQILLDGINRMADGQPLLINERDQNWPEIGSF